MTLLILVNVFARSSSIPSIHFRSPTRAKPRSLPRFCPWSWQPLSIPVLSIYAFLSCLVNRARTALTYYDSPGDSPHKFTASSVLIECAGVSACMDAASAISDRASSVRPPNYGIPSPSQGQLGCELVHSRVWRVRCTPSRQQGLRSCLMHYISFLSGFLTTLSGFIVACPTPALAFSRCSSHSL